SKSDRKVSSFLSFGCEFPAKLERKKKKQAFRVMDKISDLSDDLLIKILSLVPTTDVIAMSILSKRWRCLWRLVPSLIFGEDDEEEEDREHEEFTSNVYCRNFSQFVYGTLLLHNAPVLERFHLNSASECGVSEVDLWVRIAVDRFVRDLKIRFRYGYELIRLPSSLFRSETVETLELRWEVPSRCSFRSLKTLRLLFVKYADEESFSRLISNCPVLEDLVVETCHDDNVTTFTINVPSLQSLSIRHTLQDFGTDDDVFVVHYHSLKHLTIVDYFSGIEFIGHNTPKLVEANLLSLSCQAKVLASFPNIKRLSLCLDKEYPTGSVLSQLVRLELCSCESNWKNMLVIVLQHCPKLQVLNLALNHLVSEDSKVCWIQPSCVPECLLFHLKTFEWSEYGGSEEEKQVAIYILKNSMRLVTATIYPDPLELASKQRKQRSLFGSLGHVELCLLLKGDFKMFTYTDRISHLSDDLLLRILSLIPVSDAISTSILSKRWRSLWKKMQKLEYDENSRPNIGSIGFVEFCGRSLQLHEAPLLKTLNLNICNHSDSIDSLLFPSIRSTLLEISITSSHYSPIRFSSNLNVFQTLVVMKLQEQILVDVSVDSPVCFRSLNALHLTRVRYSCDQSLSRLLSACPVLEDLFLERLCRGDKFLTISVPSLQRLYIIKQDGSSYDDEPRFEINVPSLIYLMIDDRQGSFDFTEDMPKLVEANVSVCQFKSGKLLKSLASVERLSVNLFISMVTHLTDRFYCNRLLHLELHIHQNFRSNLLLRLLQDSPKLQVLKLHQRHWIWFGFIDEHPCFVPEPSSVPECLSFHLETLEWIGYGGSETEEEKEAAAYIFKKARCLKSALISLQSTVMKKDKTMIKELESMSKASTSCQLVIQLSKI
ncbi:unnamed protein product, partial [Thlaspi arvense]